MNNRIHTLGSLKANKSSSSTVTTTDVASRSADVPRQATTSAADIETEVVSLIDYTSNLLRAGQGVSVATASLSRRFEAFLNENYKRPISNAAIAKLIAEYKLLVQRNIANRNITPDARSMLEAQVDHGLKNAFRMAVELHDISLVAKAVINQTDIRFANTKRLESYAAKHPDVDFTANRAEIASRQKIFTQLNSKLRKTAATTDGGDDDGDDDDGDDGEGDDDYNETEEDEVEEEEAEVAEDPVPKRPLKTPAPVKLPPAPVIKNKRSDKAIDLVGAEEEEEVAPVSPLRLTMTVETTKYIPRSVRSGGASGASGAGSSSGAGGSSGIFDLSDFDISEGAVLDFGPHLGDSREKDLAAKISKLQDELGVANANNLRLQKTLNAETARLRLARVDVTSQLESEKLKISDELKAERRKVTDLERKLTEANTRYNTLHKDFDNVSESVRDLESRHDNMQATLKTREEEFAKYKVESEAFSTRVKAIMSNGKQKLSSMQVDIDMLRKENEQLKQQLALSMDSSEMTAATPFESQAGRAAVRSPTKPSSRSTSVAAAIDEAAEEVEDKETPIKKVVKKAVSAPLPPTVPAPHTAPAPPSAVASDDERSVVGSVLAGGDDVAKKAAQRKLRLVNRYKNLLTKYDKHEIAFNHQLGADSMDLIESLFTMVSDDKDFVDALFNTYATLDSSFASSKNKFAQKFANALRGSLLSEAEKIKASAAPTGEEEGGGDGAAKKKRKAVAAPTRASPAKKRKGSTEVVEESEEELVEEEEE